METRREVIKQAVEKGLSELTGTEASTTAMVNYIADAIMDIPCEPGLDIPAEMRRLYRAMKGDSSLEKAQVLVLLNDAQRNSLTRRDK